MEYENIDLKLMEVSWASCMFSSYGLLQLNQPANLVDGIWVVEDRITVRLYLINNIPQL